MTLWLKETVTLNLPGLRDGMVNARGRSSSTIFRWMGVRPGRVERRVAYPMQELRLAAMRIPSPWRRSPNFEILAVDASLVLLTGGGGAGFTRVSTLAPPEPSME